MYAEAKILENPNEDISESETEKTFLSIFM